MVNLNLQNCSLTRYNGDCDSHEWYIQLGADASNQSHEQYVAIALTSM